MSDVTNSAASFAVGDVVRLKTGGQNMTIAEISGPSGSETLTCTWIQGGTSKREPFPAERLLAAPVAA